MRTVHFDGVSLNISIWPDEPAPRPNWKLEKQFIRFALTRLHEENENMPEDEIRARVKESLAAFHVDFAERRKKQRTIPRIAGKTATGRAFALAQKPLSKAQRRAAVIAGRKGRGVPSAEQLQAVRRPRFRWVPPGERKAA